MLFMMVTIGCIFAFFWDKPTHETKSNTLGLTEALVCLRHGCA